MSPPRAASTLLTVSSRLGPYLGILCLLAAGCASVADPLGTLAPSDTPMPTFALQDANPTSPSFDEAVSVDDIRGRVGAWYFGHAT